MIMLRKSLIALVVLVLSVAVFGYAHAQRISKRDMEWSEWVKVRPEVAAQDDAKFRLDITNRLMRVEWMVHSLTQR
jgi:hypothetical protein